MSIANVLPVNTTDTAPVFSCSISIILPAKDEAEGLARVLPSLRAAYPQAEILVIDDGSTDATARVAAEHDAKDRLVEKPEARAQNFGHFESQPVLAPGHRRKLRSEDGEERRDRERDHREKDGFHP